MKTFDKKDVFTLVTAEEAKAYIGKQGYFGDSLEELEEDIKKGCSGKLVNVYPDRYASIVFRPYACETSYGLFIPTDKVKEVEEKKWRAFETINEFVQTLGLEFGDILRVRYKTAPLVKIVCMFAGYQEFEGKLTKLILGDMRESLKYFFNTIEVFNRKTKKWQPFGVEE